ncbi:MAG: outer membrane lipid asymmetry maintenance protein MlaD [Alphaproteobacteria bacterium]|nr:outer membrane lipid asymmetry maintenance protein MlaD [Alphaproteobacteria bacterium]
MGRNTIETILGAVVLAVAAFFLAFAFTATGQGTVSGYEVKARFSQVGGLKPGADVRIGGIKVGVITEQGLDPETYQAEITFTVQDDILLPLDSSAKIASDGLLGGTYLELQPGGDFDMIEPGGAIEFTQSAVDVVDLLGRFIFSAAQQAEGTQGGSQ